jgi:hypothetical protein
MLMHLSYPHRRCARHQRFEYPASRCGLPWIFIKPHLSAFANPASQLVSTLNTHPHSLSPLSYLTEVRLLPKCRFVRRHAFYGFGGSPIHQPYDMASRLAPQSSQKSCRVKQVTDSLKNRVVSSFSNSIMLWCVMYGEFLLRAFRI